MAPTSHTGHSVVTVLTPSTLVIQAALVEMLLVGKAAVVATSKRSTFSALSAGARGPVVTRVGEFLVGGM